MATLYYQTDEDDDKKERQLTMDDTREYEELDFNKFDRCSCGGRFLPIIVECDYKRTISIDTIIGKSFPTQLKLLWACELCGIEIFGI